MRKTFTEMLNKSRSVVADELMFTATHKFFDNNHLSELQDVYNLRLVSAGFEL